MIGDPFLPPHLVWIMALGVEGRDPYPARHCTNVSGRAVAIGRILGVDQDTLDALRLAGILHDLGKLAIADNVLQKPGPLDVNERRLIEQHSVMGEALLEGISSLEQARPIVRHHHEKLNGSGYPDGLRGEQIPMAARIVAVCDVYDALTHERPYKGACSSEEAIHILFEEVAAGFWDRDVVGALIRTLSRRR